MRSFAIVLSLLGLAHAHLAAWHRGMYCLDGASGQVDLNTADPVTPLYKLTKNDWWFHHINKCDEFPPAPGDFLDLPAGGHFQVEIASNRAKTSLSYSGRDISDWPDGGHYPEDYDVPSCISSPNMHTQNQSMAAGSAFAISYQSDIKQVTPENLVVFSVRYNTPWKRVAVFDVPAAMPACPPEGCICAWGWIPNGCGEPNMYHQGFRCRVTNSTSNIPLATPKPPVWCEDQPNNCTKGAKQMLYWHQADGNNIITEGLDLAGQPKSPAYNMKAGFADGAQNDIFASPASASPGNQSSPTPSSSSPGNQSSPTPSSSPSHVTSSVSLKPHSLSTQPTTAPTHATKSGKTGPSTPPSPSHSPATTSVTLGQHAQSTKPVAVPIPNANTGGTSLKPVSSSPVQQSVTVTTGKPSPRCKPRNENNHKRDTHGRNRLRRSW